MNCELCGEVIENESIGIYNKHYHFECTHRSKTPPHSFVPNMKIPNLSSASFPFSFSMVKFWVSTILQSCIILRGLPRFGIFIFGTKE